MEEISKDYKSNIRLAVACLAVVALILITIVYVITQKPGIVARMYEPHATVAQSQKK